MLKKGIGAGVEAITHDQEEADRARTLAGIRQAYFAKHSPQYASQYEAPEQGLGSQLANMGGEMASGLGQSAISGALKGPSIPMPRDTGSVDKTSATQATDDYGTAANEEDELRRKASRGPYM